MNDPKVKSLNIQTGHSILMAEDDPEDRMLVRDALDETGIDLPLFFVENGYELLDFLKNEGAYTDRKKYPQPALIILDLNMPRKDGREVLAEIKDDPKLKRIPVVVLSTSGDEEDILLSYSKGVNSFITKPVKFSRLVDIMRSLGEYWFQIVNLPHNN